MSNPASRHPNFLPTGELCSGDPLIQMVDIVKTFKNAAGEFTALKGVTACFYPGEFVSVVGKSGSGKSTLVNMLTGIDHPTSGTVRVGDTYVHSMSENDMSIWRGRNLGIVFQFFQLLPTLTLLENVMLPMYLAGLYTPQERERRALELLETVGLHGMAEKLPAAVSGGQQQSAAIARALANDPPILIADEPTGNLDSRTADEVFDLFSGLIDQGKTILMVTHDIGLAQRTTRTMLISDGELINPWLVNALPNLSHSWLLWLSHRMQPQVFLPGEAVPGPAEGSDWMALVTGGKLEVLESSNGKGSSTASRLEPGQLFASFGLNGNGHPRARLRVSPEEPADVLLVGGPDFRRWLDDHSTARDALQQAAQVRAANGNGAPGKGYPA